jgi:hypothetical protein
LGCRRPLRGAGHRSIQPADIRPPQRSLRCQRCLIVSTPRHRLLWDDGPHPGPLMPPASCHLTSPILTNLFELTSIKKKPWPTDKMVLGVATQTAYQPSGPLTAWSDNLGLDGRGCHFASCAQRVYAACVRCGCAPCTVKDVRRAMFLVSTDLRRGGANGNPFGSLIGTE